jgi:hypothetical protein
MNLSDARLKPALQRYCTENWEKIFPVRKLRGLGPSFYIHTVYLWAIYIFPRSVCLFGCIKIGGQILGIHKSLTDVWIWKLGLRRRSLISGNTKFESFCSEEWWGYLLPVLLGLRTVECVHCVPTLLSNVYTHHTCFPYITFRACMGGNNYLYPRTPCPIFLPSSNAGPI